MKKNLNIDKTVATVTILNIIQVGMILAILVYDYSNEILLTKEHKHYNGELLLFSIVVFGILISILTFRHNRRMIRDRIEQNVLQETLEQVESLNKTLRGQRHDFINHLQVVYSLMEMKNIRKLVIILRKFLLIFKR